MLCGGRGERLRPITDSIPKAMVDVAGRPFLATLIEQLGEQGIERFVFCTGYRGDCVSKYFDDGSRFGTEIVYSNGPALWPTGRRLYEARSLLDQRFLLMYSDNFAMVKLATLVDQHLESGATATLSTVRKHGGNVSDGGHSVTYSRHRSEVLPRVEVGYMIVERDPMLSTMTGLPLAPDVDFADVLVALSESGSLGAVQIHGGYQSISDPTRLEFSRTFMSPKRLLLIDRDGTINEKPKQGEYVARQEDFKLIAQNVDAMVKLAEIGFQFAVITNQAGVARGVVDPDELDRIHQYMVSTLAERGVTVRGVYVSPHHWEEESFDRKPNPGLFFKASQELQFRLDRVIYVGDDIRDCQAAANAGCSMVYITADGENDHMPVSTRQQWIVRNLGEAVPTIRSFYEGFER